MNLELRREPSTADCTFGKLYIDNVYACETLEDVVREVKIKGETAIPAGRYRIIVNHSQRFGKDMPLLLNVAGFDGIRIHSGNVAADTEGCILVGTARSDVAVLNSRVAFTELFQDILDALNAGEQVWIDVA